MPTRRENENECNEKQFIAWNLLDGIRNCGPGGERQYERAWTLKRCKRKTKRMRECEREREREQERERMATKSELLYSIFTRCCVMNAKIRKQPQRHNQNGMLGMAVFIWAKTEQFFNLPSSINNKWPFLCHVPTTEERNDYACHQTFWFPFIHPIHVWQETQIERSKTIKCGTPFELSVKHNCTGLTYNINICISQHGVYCGSIRLATNTVTKYGMYRAKFVFCLRKSVVSINNLHLGASCYSKVIVTVTTSRISYWVTFGVHKFRAQLKLKQRIKKRSHERAKQRDPNQMC